MSTRSPISEQPTTSRAADRYDDTGGEGWLAFAGVMLSIVGIMNFIYGIAAIDSANFYIANAKYVVSDLNTWGWVMVIIGAVQFVGALLIFSANQFGRWIGIISAGANSIAQLMFLPSYPLLSLALFSIDVLVIYGLVAHGGRRRELA
jgi:hypothetical protein